MARFLLFVGIIFSLIALFAGKEIFWDTEKIYDTPAEHITQNASTSVERASQQQATTQKRGSAAAPAEIFPVDPAPARSAEPISAAVKPEPKVSTPLVHYAEQNRAPNTLASAGVTTWTNTYREQNGLKPLQRNSSLDAAAIIKVHDMFDKQYFEHVSPTGKNSADLVSGVGYEYLWVGENLALGIFSDEKDLVDAWMASPGHRANILNAHFEEIGIGVDEGTYEGRHVWMAVQEFGKPASSCPEPEVSLKTQIEGNRTKISELSAQASALVAEINAMEEGERDNAAYNRKVSEYNTLIAVLNPLIQGTKSLIDIYNQEINEYNACIEA